jgi:predicted ATPase
MLSEVHLVNFKVAKDLPIPLRKLTLLAGLNGSGKSTVLQCLVALYQSYLVADGSDFLLRGPLASLGQGSDVLSIGAPSDSIEIHIKQDDKSFAWSFSVAPGSDQFTFDVKPTELPEFIELRRFQYLQADRIVPQTLYPLGSKDYGAEGILGAKGQYTIDYLNQNENKHVSEIRRCKHDERIVGSELWKQVSATPGLVDQVAAWLQAISPGAHLQAEPISGTDDVMLSFRYLGMETGSSGNFRPTHVGFGLTYCLPIITACLAAEPGSLLLIENPEAHLHPQGQANLGRLLALCASDGVQVIAETHSDHLLNGVRLAVKGGEIDAKDTKLAYFTREIESGEAYIQAPEILSDGQLSNRPEGFFDQWSSDLDKLLTE